MLNRTKGPAMHSPRAQADKKLYQFTMKHRVEDQPNLTLRQELVEGSLIEPRRAAAIVGVMARGDTLYRAAAVVLTTGTFLKALMHTGEARRAAAGQGTSRRKRSATPRATRLRARALQDRHAVPAQWPHDRLREVRSRSRAMPIRGRSASPPSASRSRRWIAISRTPTTRCTT